MSEAAVVLLSGGLDSATVASLARRDGYTLHAMSFSYGQRHDAELDAAARVAEHVGVVAHKVVPIDLRTFGGSALTADIDVPKDRSESEMADGIPITYVPARNTIFLSFALAWAEVLGSSHVFIGINALDYSGYPDCRPEYLAAFETMARLATRAGVQGDTELHIHAPLLQLTKAEIVTLGTDLGVDYALTVSCYDADDLGRACGRCDSCTLRRKGFAEAGLDDPHAVPMTYVVKEIFFTLQGEGCNTGMPTVFCRFAGCNLWTGREQHRATVVCQFCDTDFVGTDGPGGGQFASAADLAAAVADAWTPDDGDRFVVCTGGEPLLQLDAALVDAMHERGFRIAIETNGTCDAPDGIDWVCVSPKAGAELVLRRGDELKLVYPQAGLEPTDVEDLAFDHFLLSPMDGDVREANTALAVAYCLAHPRWRLSLQTHKYLGIP